MRALIAGFGSSGQRHAANLRKLCGSVELMVVRGSGKPDDRSEALGVKVAPDIEYALDANPDFAVIATPSHLRTDILVPLLERGVPCYVEKPVVATMNDVNRLHDLLDRLAVVPITQVGCNLRFLPSLIKLRSLVHAGTLGKVARASIEVGQWLPDWRPGQDYRESYSARRESGGGVILDLIHEIDAVRWLFGEFEKVHAMAGHFSSLDVDCEDTACLLLGKERGGPLVAVSLDYVSRRRMRRYVVVGDEGSLIWDLNKGCMELVWGNDVEAIDCGQSGFNVGQTYVASMREFLSCVRDRRETSQDLREGLRSVCLALRAKALVGR